MSIFQGSNSATGIYQGNTLLNAVFQGTTRIWPETLIAKAPRTDANFAMNAIQINPDGTTKYRSAYAAAGVGYTLDLGNWRKTSLPLVPGNDTFQVKVDLFLGLGDWVSGQSNSFNVWYNMNPAEPSSVLIRYVAENDQGANRAIFRVSVKDGLGNREVWYADCYKDTNGRLSKTPIPWAGSFSYPTWGGSASNIGNSYLGPVSCGVLVGKDGQITPTANSETVGTNWVTLSGYSTPDIGGGAWIKVTQTGSSGSPTSYSGPALNKWVNMESSQNISISLDEGTETTGSRTFNVKIATDQRGENIISDQTVNLTVTSTYDSSAGGGTFEEPPCLLHGMTVTMADGSSKLIQDVQVGDALLSYDIDGLPLASDDPAILNSWSSLSLTGSPSTATVVSIKPVVSTSYVVINHNIKTSPEHMHLVKTGPTWHFKRADEVVSGDVFMTEAGVEQTITDVYAVNNPETVYKMDVENLDVFYANGVLTHNLKV